MRWVFLSCVRMYSGCTRPTKTCLTYAPEMVSASVLAAMGQVHIAAWTSELPTAYIFAVVLKLGFKACT
ncbi:hypothetical protein Plhal304r1_c022g0078111 [Plasmopara halstedii]